MSTVRRTLLPAATVLAAGLAFLIGGAGHGSVALAAPDGVQVAVSPATDLPAEGGEVTVTGSGFDVAGPGIYVGLAATAGYDPSSPDSFAAVTWVKPGGPDAPGMATLAADGTFEITLAAPAAFGEGAGAVDCRETECAIYTLAAHGSPDRSQDSVTDLDFAGGPAAGGAASESTSEAVAGAASPSAEARGVNTASEESSTSTGLIVGLVTAAVLVIAVLAFVLISRRRAGGAGSTA